MPALELIFTIEKDQNIDWKEPISVALGFSHSLSYQSLKKTLKMKFQLEALKKSFLNGNWCRENVCKFYAKLNGIYITIRF